MSILDEYLNSTRESKKVYDRAVKVMPSGSTRNAIFFPPYPFYVAQAKGSHIWDLDGNKLIDYWNNATSLILGHAHPKIVKVVKDQLERGINFGTAHELEWQLADRIVRMHPSVEMVRFCTSGTEACMNALRLARAYQGKDKVLMFEGHYHGTTDDMLSGFAPGCKGLPKTSYGNRMIVPFNDVEAVKKAVKENRNELAAVIMEPNWGCRGVNIPKNGYLEAVREITEDNEVLLIFDEVRTGFRNAPGGAAEYFKVIPDIATFGKNVGGGFPLGAFGANMDLMKLFSFPKTPYLEKRRPPILHSGTFNSHPIVMRAGIATVDELTPHVYECMDRLGQSVRDGIIDISEEVGVKVQVTGSRSVFELMFSEKELETYADVSSINPDLDRLLRLGLINRGVFLAVGGWSVVSAATSMEDAQQTLKAIEETLTVMKPWIHEIAPGLA